MILFLIALVACLIVGCGRRNLGEDILDRNQTTAVNGFFIGWVFLRHVCDYIPGVGEGVLGKTFGGVEFLAGQLIVATFLFFSGYGVMEQIKRKGHDYVKTFPKLRLLKVLLDFDVAVLMYLAFGLVVGKNFGMGQILLSFIGWDSIGNSNWYIFLVLACYAITYIAYQFRTFNEKPLLICIGILAVAFVLFYIKEFWWWDTLLAYAAGMIYSSRKEWLEKRLRNHYWLWLVGFCIGMVLFRCASKAVGLECPARVVFLNLRTILFALAVVMVMMKVSFGNPVINWMGKNLFPIYIYQRLGMMIMLLICGQDFVNRLPYLYVIGCMGVTIGFVLIYQRWLKVKL